MSKNIEVSVNKAAIVSRVRANKQRATTIVTNEFIKDANYYCREDTGELERSAIRASRPEEGVAIWDTDYARDAYYIGTPSTDRNPNASLQWADKAAKQNRDKYKDMIRKVNSGG